MNPNQNPETSVNPKARPAGVPVRNRLPSTPSAQRNVSQPPRETGALPRAVLHSASVKKPTNPCARHRGVEALLANHKFEEVRTTDWELFAIWACVVLSFAGLFFCFYVIWAKCRIP